MPKTVEAKLTPPRRAAAQLLAYGLKVHDYPANFYFKNETAYTRLFSAIGDVPLIYLPKTTTYRGMDKVWEALRLTVLRPQAKFKWWVKPREETFASLNQIFQQFIQAADPNGELDSGRFGIALALALNNRNTYYADNGQLQFRYSFADCYKLAQITVDVNAWAEILNIWEQGLPWDVLVEIANGMSPSLMLELYGQPEYP